MDDISHFVRLSERKTKKKSREVGLGKSRGSQHRENEHVRRFGMSIVERLPWSPDKKLPEFSSLLDSRVISFHNCPCLFLAPKLYLFRNFVPSHFPEEMSRISRFVSESPPMGVRKNSLTLARVDTQVNLLRKLFTSQFQSEKAHF